ncbi:phosphoribosylformylglycinamidine synthase subunit PurQ [Daejeonella oryzae]|uniref:phosphoribosylformylglycinamidine synthase subunit PurQ n=1 Tax=Daejeonella oryzae TaxID=1122943 RepID=UPI0003FCEEE5|nr:phosphoribosylformylglycinamidine synthase subunit PurQ [Daejeonella oryzae]
MKFGVVIFPGSNCDEDVIYVLEHIMGQEVVRLWHKDHDLKGVDFVVLPGGFSFGDYLRSGAIARFSPVMQEVIQFANKGGYVLGICNGFQILAEAGLVPGALLHNSTRKFICKNIYLKTETTNSLITSALDPDKILKIPIAHGEGNYFAEADVLKKLEDNDQILFRYCDEAGNITQDSNINGSLVNIAGVCNEKRNVFGMMPHPERAADSILGNQDGLGIFESILKTVNA